MPTPPAWIEALVDQVAMCMEPHGELGPMGSRCWENADGSWTILVYPTAGEIVSGADDGAIVVPGFTLDVQDLSRVFGKLVEIRWKAQDFSPKDPHGPNLSFEGVYAGHNV